MKSQKKIIGAMGLPVNDRGQFLITLRHEPKRIDIHHKWQLTGGGIEYGETPEEALKREFQEELGVDVKILYPYPIVRTNMYTFNQHGIHVLLLTYIVTIGNQVVNPFKDEIADCRWVYPEESNALACLPNTSGVIHEAATVVKKYKLLLRF